MSNLNIYTEKLRKSGLRPTRQRLKICEVLFSPEKTFHFTINDLTKIIREKLSIKVELSFLNTPNINKSIIDNEMNISGNTRCKFSIMVSKVGLNYMFQLSLLLTLQLYF